MAIRHFEDSPSPDDFSSQIESKSVPAVFKGCIKEWKAFCRWNPSNGGLDYLQKQAGSSTVEAMLSKSAPVFNGDLRNHERVPLQFSTFISFCKQLLQTTTHVHHKCVEQEGCELAKTDSKETCSTSSDASQVYLAQVPILNFENQERSPLEILQEDIQKPAFIENKALSSINLWMNSSQSRSSTHYDPHHNLLCIVAGYKKVVLWAPSASQVLYPMPIYGEASNHSAVDIGCPDFSLHSRAKYSMNYSHTVILHAGDALFIPEGWFHQVDSNDLTIAVNFWWQSNMVLNMLEHMDAYYLRRVMRRLVDKEMNQMLQEIPIDNTKAAKDVCGPTKGAGHRDIHSVGQNSKKNMEGNHQQGKMLHQLEPLAVRSLHQLVSLVHDSVNVASQSQEVGSTTLEGSAVSLKGDNRQIGRTDSFLLVDDSVASILSSLEPLLLQYVLLAMVHNFPRTLEALVLHSLSPVAAEVLTRKFDEMDQQITKEEQSEFFRQFYSVFDDQFAAMDAILNGKESFACQAFRNVLDHYLGVNSGSLQ